MAIAELSIIPSEILVLIQNPPLLKGESRQDYYGLLAALSRDIGPADLPEWLWVVQLLDCSWEIFRNRRYRAKLIDLNRNQALRRVILKMTPGQIMKNEELDKAVARWTANPGHFDKHEIDPETVAAMALAQTAPSLENIDKMLERLQRRCDTILQQLEYRREVFAHRARRAANRVLNEETVHAIELVDPVTPNQSLSVEAETTIVPELPAETEITKLSELPPENDAPNAEESPKASAEPPQSDS